MPKKAAKKSAVNKAVGFSNQNAFKPVVVVFYTLIAATLWKCTTIPVSDFSDVWPAAFVFGTYKLVAALVLFGLIPMGIVKCVFREKCADYGLQLGIAVFTVRSFLIAVPFLVGIALWTCHQSAFFEVYPLNEAIRPQNAHIGCGIFTIHALLYLGYYWGWEFLFRGFLQHGLSERCGVPTAVLAQTLATTMLHYGHPTAEVVGSVAAGLFWGFLAVRTKSILSGFAQHALLGIAIDALLVFGRPAG